MIFVTGGSGMVGSRLLAKLLKEPENEIIALKRLSSDLSLTKKTINNQYSNPEEQFARIQWVDGSLEDINFLEDIISNGADVYHAAAMVSFNPKDNQALRTTNIEGTANLVNACIKVGVRKFCHVSSIAALGRGEVYRPVTETDYRTSSKGTSVYSATKFEAELEVWRGMAEGLNAVIINPSVIIGHGFWDKGSSELITTVYKGLKFFTRGINGYVDADDVAEAMIQLMKSDISDERFILSSEDWSYENLFKSIAKNLNVKGPTLYASPFLGEIAWRILSVISIFTRKQPLITKATAKNAKAIFRYDSSKIKDRIGFEFIPIEKSIASTCERFLEDRNN